MAKSTNKIVPTAPSNANPEEIKFPSIPGASSSTPLTAHPPQTANPGGKKSPKNSKLNIDVMALRESVKNQRIDEMNIEDLRKQGFPLKMVKVFLETADNLDCIVMSRTPEGPTTTLIDDGYDLKGFEIKSKSCNWGPMAGFLCKLPPFNKVGFDKIKYNYGYLVGFYTKWTSNSGTDKRTYEQLFQPIRITEERKKELFTDKDNIFGLGKKDEDYIVIGDDLVYGYCSNLKKNTVKIEYLLQKDPRNNLWKMFHGIIQCFNGQWAVYNGEEQPIFFAEKDSSIQTLITMGKIGGEFQLTEPVKNQINTFRNKNQLDDLKPFIFRPIEGAVNPHPPYPREVENKTLPGIGTKEVPKKIIEGPDNYKNCVTGDYDLFACWPKSDYSWKEMLRQSELKFKSKNIEAEGSLLIIGLKPKKTSNQLLVEFILGVPALNNLEHADYGNTNNLTMMAAGMLNSLAGLIYESKDKPKVPNKAFHSDEGGRPLITDIDFPVSCFLPKDLLTKTNATHDNFRKGMIENASDFIDMISFCNLNNYKITLSHGWLIFLITLALDEKIRSEIVPSITVNNPHLKVIYPDVDTRNEKVIAIKKKVEKYFKANTFKDDEYKAKVLTGLLGYCDKAKFRNKNNMSATDAFLAKIAKVFLLFLDMKEPDEQVILNKVKAAKTITFEKADFKPTNS
jgi:hypothetical protein